MCLKIHERGDKNLFNDKNLRGRKEKVCFTDTEALSPLKLRTGLEWSMLVGCPCSDRGLAGDNQLLPMVKKQAWEECLLRF